MVNEVGQFHGSALAVVLSICSEIDLRGILQPIGLVVMSSEILRFRLRSVPISWRQSNEEDGSRMKEGRFWQFDSFNLVALEGVISGCR
ncbi:hypothetical protein R1flu_012884 [Riccia fluitans]|uniref:Uncharacterized protein n=1 Tax=Riccia fluitans TaxID=41844 RepID=A0ABD1ZBW0_9MARC